MTKKGSGALRRTLFIIMQVLLQTKPVDNPVYDFLIKKQSEGNHYYSYMNACEADYCVKFYTAVNLAAEFAEAVQMNRLSKLEKNFSKINLLIIDELSYLTFNRYQSEMLFQIISERSKRASVIISTNLDFSELNQLFENEMMLAALIDRVTFRSFVLNMNCNSSYHIDSTINNI